MRPTKRQIHKVCGFVAATLTGIQFSAGTVLQILAMHGEGEHQTSISIPFLALGFAATLAWVIWGATGEKALWVAIIPNGCGVASYAVLATLVIANSSPTRSQQRNSDLMISHEDTLMIYKNENSPQ